jgi:hypothetical protein
VSGPDTSWDWTYRKWRPISYRLKRAIAAVLKTGPGNWWPTGEGKDLRFERIIDPDSQAWPYDREVIEVLVESGCRSRTVLAYR